jgi:hypothetical protein
MGSPYVAGTRRFQTRRGDPVTALMSPGRGQLVGANGEMNAYSNADLMQAIGSLQQMVQNGEVIESDGRSMEEVSAARHAELVEAYSDQSGQKWQALGQLMADEIWETLGREGFARKILAIKPIGKGDVGRLRVRRKDVVAYYVTSDPNVIGSQNRQMWIYPPDFYLTANILIEQKEIEQSTGDLLEDKYNDGLENTMVAEDNALRRLSLTAATGRNDAFLFNVFTPTVYASMIQEIRRWGIPATNMILAFDLWTDIIADTEFSTWFSPVAKHELIMQGTLGSILGVNLITDAFRYETLKVLEAGEVFAYGAPNTVGGIIDRGELSAKPVDQAVNGKAEMGWFFSKVEGMAVVNNRSIVYGQRM